MAQQSNGNQPQNNGNQHWIYNTFVGHFSPGLDQLREFELSQSAAAEPETSLGQSIKSLFEQAARPEISASHCAIAGACRERIAACDKDGLCEKLEEFADAKTDLAYSEPSTQMLESRIYRAARDLAAEVRAASEVPWGDLARV